jgi:ribosomal protein S27AE
VPALYFLGNSLVGESPQYSKWDDHKVNHQNIAHFCPECGDIWGRIFDDRLAGWFAATTYCPQHGGGSFIFPWRYECAELPEAVLRYELNLLLEKCNG